MKGLKTFTVSLVSIGGLLLMLWFILPSVYISFGYVTVALSSVALIIFAFLADRYKKEKYFIVFLPCLMLGLMYFAVPYNLQLKPAVNVFQQMVMYTAPMILASFWLSLDQKNENYVKIRKVFTVLLIMCVAFVFIVTMRELSITPNVCRALASGEKTDELMELRERNVGGFGFSYAMGIFEVFTFYYVLKSKGKERIIYLIVTALLIVFVVRSQYMTLLILCMAINLLTCLRFTKSLVLRIFIVLVTVVLLILAGPITAFLSRIITGDKLSERMYQVSGLFEGAGYSSMRIDYIKGCLNIFSSNFLIGKFDLINDVEANFYSNHSHSTQLKILVDTGIVGFIIYNFYLLYLRYYVSNLIRKAGKNPAPFIMCFWFAWALSWLNPIYQVYEIPFALYLIVPLLICFNIKSSDRIKSNGREHKSKTVEYL